jgi:anti-sigma regulatory factor (Ser/Thr protein kinase)
MSREADQPEGNPRPRRCGVPSVVAGTLHLSTAVFTDGRPPRQHHHLAYDRTFPRSLTSPGRVREETHLALAGWGVDSDTLDAVKLIISELVTNSVVHTQTPSVQVSVVLRGSTLLTEVLDYGPVAAPRTGDAERPDDESGRGLFLVDCLATSWGSRPAGSGTVAWARLDLPAVADESASVAS